MKHAISENVYAGIAMARRAQYQYGTVLEKGRKGALSIGIGMGQSTGQGGTHSARPLKSVRIRLH